MVPAIPEIWAGFLTILVAGPWLAGGYIFGTDWPGPRRFDFPTNLSSIAPAQVALAAVSKLISAEWTAKVFVLGLLFVAASGAYRAVPKGGFIPRAVAAAVFVFNPFVFGRLHYGQEFLVAGFGLLPWAALWTRGLLEKPSSKAALLLAAALAAMGFVTIHLVLVAIVLIAILFLAHLLSSQKRTAYLKRLGPSLTLSAIATLVATSYWVVPLVLGRGREAGVVAKVSRGDLGAYAAIPDPQLGLVPNLLGLYGFWAEDSGRFASMKLFVPFWPAVLVLLLGVGAVGAVAVLRNRRDPLAPWVMGLLAAAVIALVLEMGVSNPWTSGLVGWLDAHVSFYRGMRDAGKWAALLALVYSQLIALGAAAILDWLKKRTEGAPKNEWIGGLATGLLLAVPLYYGNGLLFGAHGEIKPSSYPAGWYEADRAMVAGPSPGRALFLPWHEYMAYSFIQNQNKVVASPAPTFFSVPVLVSANPEVPGITPPNDPEQVAISKLVGEGAHGQWGPVLTQLNIKYVLVAREVDWASFAYFDKSPDFVKVGDFGSILLYRVNQPTQGQATRSP